MKNRLPINHQTSSARQFWNQTKYTENFFTNMIPICKEALLDTNIESPRISPDQFDACSQFIPALSNHGLCLTRNGAALDSIFRKSNHLSSFQNVFVPRGYINKVANIKEDQSGHHFSFIVDGNKYKDLKRGTEWNEPSFNKFQLAVHSPNEIGDIRGWSNKIINVASGQITTIRINLSQQKSKESIRGIMIEKRGCKFPDENRGLSSIEWYSNVNCLLDCKMEIAEKVCNCRPLDYPTSVQHNNLTLGEKAPICDFNGNSCFNHILQKEVELKCKRKCVPDCDKTNFQIDISVTPLDPKKRICDLQLEPFTLLEHHIKHYVRSLFLEQNWFGFPPERRMMNIMKDILQRKTENDTYYGDEDVRMVARSVVTNMVKDESLKASKNNTKHFDEILAFKKDCAQKLEYDIAAVVVSIDSPTFSRTTKNVRVTFQGKLATIGKIIFMI